MKKRYLLILAVIVFGFTYKVILPSLFAEKEPVSEEVLPPSTSFEAKGVSIRIDVPATISEIPVTSLDFLEGVEPLGELESGVFFNVKTEKGQFEATVTFSIPEKKAVFVERDQEWTVIETEGYSFRTQALYDGIADYGVLFLKE